MIAFEQARMAEPPLDLQLFAEQLSQQEEHDPTGKRESERFQMATWVPAVLIDEQLQPTGAPFLVMTRNISTSGIALVHTQPIKEGNIAIELTLSLKLTFDVPTLRFSKTIGCSPSRYVPTLSAA